MLNRRGLQGKNLLVRKLFLLQYFISKTNKLNLKKFSKEVRTQDPGQIIKRVMNEIKFVYLRREVS